MTLRMILAALALSLLAPASLAQDAPTLSDAEVQQRSLAIEKTLRCVVCQNQSIADSHSTLAEDMRGIVENRVRMGETGDEVRAYMQARYGNFVLMTPPVESKTYLLWFGPGILLLIGLGWFLLHVRKAAKTSDGEIDRDLTDDEKIRLAEFMKPNEEKASDQ